MYNLIRLLNSVMLYDLKWSKAATGFSFHTHYIMLEHLIVSSEFRQLSQGIVPPNLLSIIFEQYAVPTKFSIRNQKRLPNA